MRKIFWALIVSAMMALTLPLITGGAIALETQSIVGGEVEGTNVRWEFNAATGNISFTGTGKMHDYGLSSSGDRPWHEYADQITSATVGEGITSISGSTFAYCSKLVSVKVADSVTFIDHHAFYKCSNLTEINLPDGVTALANDAFNGCNRLDNIVIPQSMNVIQSSVFDACYGLKHLYIRSPKIVKQIESRSNYLSNKITNLDAIYFESSLAATVPEYVKTYKPHTCIVVRDGVGYTQYSKNEPSEYTLRGYIQLCPDGDTYNMRFLVEGDSEYLTQYTKATVTLTFTKNGDPAQTKKMEAVANQAYTSVLANGEKHPARDGYGFVGLVIEDIGNNDVAALSASVTLTAANGDWVQYELGSVKDVLAHLQNPAT